ncbi:phenylacetate--CoA ligase family protein [Salidesulfovibrio brasiliensis]|uniref:phenylacetate--CoA ligase family protein n=1 Tax=Salidesulfovibrio brasiliensis TaxID=221711 RepID=UPI00155D8D6B|nr:phenylacetate--CoA ligase family protein [Salidesulfovibrio brasiliensis]
MSTLSGRPRYRKYARYGLLQWRDRDAVLADQEVRLAWLIEHAYETVPYYRSLFDATGYDPADEFSMEWFSSLPLLSKDIIREQGSNMLSSATPGAERIRNNSGGSTGEPLSFYQDRQVFEEMHANWMLGLSFVGWTPDDLVVSFWGNPKEFERPPGLVDRMKGWLGGNIALNAYRYNDETMSGWVPTINRLGKVFVYGYVTVLTDFARYLLENGRPVKGVRAVVTSAEKLHGHQRALIADAFSCGVHDQYGSRETPCIAAECDHGGMHLLTHSSYVEFLPDASGSGERVVVTSFGNRTMPFIRYDIGDMARSREGECPCGRGFPLMEMDIGRSCDSLVTPSGSRVFGTYFVRQMYGVDGVKAFQFRQSGPGSIELRVVRGPGFSSESEQQLTAMEGRFGRELGEPIALAVSYVDEIPRTVGGKHRHVVCDVGG